MSKKSRDKGMRGERGAAKALRDMGFPGAGRGETQSAGPKTADVVGVDGFWVEVKALKSIAILRALDQAKRDSSKGGGAVPIALVKEDRGPWAVVVDATVFARLLRGFSGSTIELRDFIQKPSRAVKIKPSKRVTKTKLANIKTEKSDGL